MDSVTASALRDISSECYREYEFGPSFDRVTYRINNPVSLYVGETTHRVIDMSGVVHCVPRPGECNCVLRWEVKAGHSPISF